MLILIPNLCSSQNFASEREDALIKEHRAGRSKPPSAVASPGPEEIEEIAFTTTQCLGRCPSYTVHFFKDGRITFVPYLFTHDKHATEGRISQEKFRDLAEAALSAGFFKLESTYSSSITDQSALYTLVASPGARKVILDYARRGPEQLRQFENKLKEAAQDAVGLP
jgi:hypothetical protein